MALVDIDEKTPNLSLRVFKRSRDHLVLLWNRPKDVDKNSVRITAKPLEGRQLIEVKDFALDPEDKAEVSRAGQLDSNTVICVINEPRNGLDERQNYYFTVSYEGYDIRQSIRVVKAGTYPDHEKEAREKNNHNHLWDSATQHWRKWHGVMHKGRFYAGVIIVPCPSCGYDGDSLRQNG